MPIGDPDLHSVGLQTALPVGVDVANLITQEERFKELATQWKAETKFLSNLTTKSMHEAYQKIIGMGPIAVPFILKDLVNNGPNDWFWALHVITNVNPITVEIARNMNAMMEAWLAWGKNAGCHPNYLQPMNSVSPISP